MISFFPPPPPPPPPPRKQALTFMQICIKYHTVFYGKETKKKKEEANYSQL